VGTFDEPAYGPFVSFCQRAAQIGVRYVDFIDPYQSAMLNNFQLKAWLQDFPAAIDEIPMNSIQRANVPTCQRANVPTCQRANVPTCQRANVPTCRRADVLEVLDAARHAEAIDGYLFVED